MTVMKGTSKRLIFFCCGFLLLIVSTAVWRVSEHFHQEEINSALLRAVERGDASDVHVLLRRGQIQMHAVEITLLNSRIFVSRSSASAHRNRN